MNHLCHTTLDTPLGAVLIARNADGLSGLWFEGQKYHPGTLAAPRRDDDALLTEAVINLCDYFVGKPLRALPLSPSGTPFQQAVWRALLAIPAGTTLSYGELARRVGRPQAVRAAAAAVGRNPLSVIIPCHRVLGADGALTGYAGGLHRKQALLTLEGAWRETTPLSATPARASSRTAMAPSLFSGVLV
ncbi:methylated-DNA--[protein]-cysteine S-methyltransferase [Hylemonella gracilis]|uniref:Methylated-DNA--protein-cysteine methyltransferase n=1 Tax=Hylemonella gracilis ATCC 19624 TaxID=887062 RepID=F3KRL9_9BURK|nr:methylated-DNA--[protein]-cysteine S-methyltransferase [Hylemonella gracilis]EGI77618.1 methylateD-DNA/protein-cysteine methyltransferase [Hylemonella gracilis ATCC 19624]